MRSVIVGSVSAEYYGINRLPPKDIDVWVQSSINNLSGDVKVIPVSILKLIPTNNGFATPDALYTIKCSHLGWTNPNWNKHKLDVLHLKDKGCKLIPHLYEELKTFWKEELGDKSFLSLKQDKESFFTDNITYIYDHDLLHEMVAFPNKPMYTKCLIKGEDVLIDKSKFEVMSLQEQVRMFREEITVIAIERWVKNPHIKKEVSWFRAYMKSLHKTITSLTKNWATDFIVLHLELFIKPDYAYFEHTLNLLNKKGN